MSTPFQRIALCTTIAAVNAPHVAFWCDQLDVRNEHFPKLLSKTLSFLRGELTSEANLLRFHDAFYEWRQQQDEQDNLAYRVMELSCAALHCACETLFDHECDDTELLLGSIESLYDEMDELGADTHDLRTYWQDIQRELSDIVPSNSQIPLPKAYFKWLSELDVSLFGLGND